MPVQKKQDNEPSYLVVSYFLENGEQDKEKKKKGYRNIPVIELNSADTSALMQLPGIGNFRARKIIEYREQLGGYYSIEQLLEVPTIDSQLVENIFPYVKVDTAGKIRKINLNREPLETLALHPYIKYRRAKIIKNYIEQHGYIRDIEHLRRVIPENDTFFKKIAPYITF